MLSTRASHLASGFKRACTRCLQTESAKASAIPAQQQQILQDYKQNESGNKLILPQRLVASIKLSPKLLHWVMNDKLKCVLLTIECKPVI